MSGVCCIFVGSVMCVCMCMCVCVCVCVCVVCVHMCICVCMYLCMGVGEIVCECVYGVGACVRFTLTCLSPEVVCTDPQQIYINYIFLYYIIFVVDLCIQPYTHQYITNSPAKLMEYADHMGLCT